MRPRPGPGRRVAALLALGFSVVAGVGLVGLVERRVEFLDQ
jgi:hypothetical protein